MRAIFVDYVTVGALPFLNWLIPPSLLSGSFLATLESEELGGIQFINDYPHLVPLFGLFQS